MAYVPFADREKYRKPDYWYQTPCVPNISLPGLSGFSIALGF